MTQKVKADEDDDTIDPWLHEWNAYLNSNEIVPEGIGMVRWWGVCGIFLLGPHPNKSGLRLL